MLECLAIVAYRQPVTRPEIEDIRSVDCGGVLRVLLDRGLVRMMGKKEEVGRPVLYGTTKQFLEFFNLKDLKELPTLKEFTELSEESVEKIRQEYGDVDEGARPPDAMEGAEELPDSFPSGSALQSDAEGDRPFAADSGLAPFPSEGETDAPPVPEPLIVGRDGPSSGDEMPPSVADLTEDYAALEIASPEEPAAAAQPAPPPPRQPSLEEEEDDAAHEALERAMNRLDDVLRFHGDASPEEDSLPREEEEDTTLIVKRKSQAQPLGEDDPPLNTQPSDAELTVKTAAPSPIAKNKRKAQPLGEDDPLLDATYSDSEPTVETGLPRLARKKKKTQPQAEDDHAMNELPLVPAVSEQAPEEDSIAQGLKDERPKKASRGKKRQKREEKGEEPEIDAASLEVTAEYTPETIARLALAEEEDWACASEEMTEPVLEYDSLNQNAQAVHSGEISAELDAQAFDLTDEFVAEFEAEAEEPIEDFENIE
jgi:hypothetical protein